MAVKEPEADGRLPGDTPEVAERKRRARARQPQGEDVVAGDASRVEATKAALASRIKQLRLARSLSGSELAERVGISAGMVSQIEHGQASPSLSTLVGLATALETRVSSFFEDVPQSGKIVRRSERPSVAYPKIGVRDEWISADPTGRLQVLLSHIDPGFDSGREPFTHGSEAECVLVLGGEITIILGEERVRLREGDTVTFPGTIPHGYVNEGDVVADLIWIITPVSY